jgi:hydroxyacylglutathione hydrolase
MMVVKKFIFNPFDENTYLVWDEKSSEAMVVDPGCSTPEEEKELSDFIEDRKLKIKYLFNTHCHIDHILGINYIKEKYKVNFYAPEADLPLLQHADKQAEAFGLEIDPVSLPDVYINEFTHTSIGETAPRFIFTPGHSPGEYCIYFEKEGILLAGDVLFRRSIGRTDLWGGNFNQLIDSIKNKLFVLPDEVIVYSGHGDNTTIGEEKTENPFIA